MGNKTSSSNVIDLSIMPRRGDFRHHTVTMTRIEALDNEQLTYPVGEKMPIQLDCISQKDVKHAFFRIMLRTAEGNSVTMCTTDEHITLQANTTEQVSMLVDTSRLVPGTYSLNIVIYEVNEFGGTTNLDGLVDVLFFEVATVPGFYNNMQWQSRYWGNVFCDKLTIKQTTF